MLEFLKWVGFMLMAFAFAMIGLFLRCLGFDGGFERKLR